MSHELLDLEKYVVTFYIANFIITIIISILSAMYLKKRFNRGTEEIIKKDEARVDAIVTESFMFRLWFKVSLHKNNPITIFLFMVVFNMSLPVVGYVFTLWTVRYLNNVSYEKRVVDTNMINLDEFESSFLKVERIFGEGSMSDLMTNEYAPKSKKLKALSSLSNNATPANLQIIRQTLSSTDDEIRMFGYAIINKAEKALNSKINHYLEIIAEEEAGDNDSAIIASAAKELGPLYWEMIYTELSHESLKSGFMKSVVEYINIAKEFYVPSVQIIDKSIDRYQKEIEKATNIDLEFQEKEKIEKEKTVEHLNKKLNKEIAIKNQHRAICTKLYILMGRVYMQQKRYEDAKTEFTLAQELNTEKLIFVLPYLAEIYYLTGNYKVVKSIMKDTEGLNLNSTLYPIIEQWKAS